MDKRVHDGYNGVYPNKGRCYQLTVKKISHHFKLTPEVAERLQKLAEFYTKAQKEDGFLIPRKITKTDIIEWLINKEYENLKEQGFMLEPDEESTADAL